MVPALVTIDIVASAVALHGEAVLWFLFALAASRGWVFVAVAAFRRVVAFLGCRTGWREAFGHC